MTTVCWAGTKMTPGSGILSGTRRSLSRRRIQAKRGRIRTETAKPPWQQRVQMGPRKSGKRVSTGGLQGRGMLEGCLPVSTQMKGHSLTAAG